MNNSELNNIERLVLRLAYLKHIRRQILRPAGRDNQTEEIGGGENKRPRQWMTEDRVTHKIELYKNNTVFNACIESLKKRGYLKNLDHNYSSEDYASAVLTEKGEAYEKENPNFIVPLNWCFCLYCKKICNDCGVSINPDTDNWDNSERKWRCAACFTVKFEAEWKDREEEIQKLRAASQQTA